MKNLIIVAVVVLAVWFVFFRKKATTAVASGTATNNNENPTGIDALITGQVLAMKPPQSLIISNTFSDGFGSQALSTS